MVRHSLQGLPLLGSAIHRVTTNNHNHSPPKNSFISPAINVLFINPTLVNKDFLDQSSFKIQIIVLSIQRLLNKHLFHQSSFLFITPLIVNKDSFRQSSFKLERIISSIQLLVIKHPFVNPASSYKELFHQSSLRKTSFLNLY